MTAADAVHSLTGPQVRQMFEAAMTWLERHVDKVNAVNVFPVPDGDTGTNMFLTMRSTLQAGDNCDSEVVSEMLAAMAHGALMGARGNSGVILSQIVRGVAGAHESHDVLNAGSFSAGLVAGSDAAYKAVTKPAEGTILTVVRETASAVADTLATGQQTLIPLLEIACSAARASVDRTPTLLPALAEAGVVDAGGLGLSILLEGMLKHLRGDSLDVAVGSETDAVGRDWLSTTEQRHATEESLYGYCTEVLIAGSSLDADAMRDQMLVLGDSVLVVGDKTLLRIHVHTDDPGAVLTHCITVGGLTQVKVDNIRGQAERFVEMHEGRVAPPLDGALVNTVAVVAGAGMANVFESVGCTKLVSGGPTMNPSAQEILDAVNECPAQDVIVMPNDKNIIMAARQAAMAAQKKVHVLESRSMPQGLAALLASNIDDSVAETLEAMREALESVRTIEVTRAVRTTTVGGLEVREGQVIAVVDDRLTLAVATPEEAVESALEGVITSATSLITLYNGAGADTQVAEALAARIREQFPTHEVDLHYGGQPHYDYIISVE